MTHISDTALLLFIMTVLTYVSAALMLSKHFFSTHKDAKQLQQPKLALSIMTFAVIVHTGLIMLTTFDMGDKPLSIGHVASVLALIVTVTMLISNRYIKSIIFLPVVCGVSALFVCLHILAPGSDKLAQNMSMGMVTHITLSLFALGTLSISFLYAVQLSYISHRLKQKKLHLMSTLPPLMSVERVLEKLMLAGAVLLFIALASGFVFIPNMLADGYAHKTLLSIVSFVIYVLALLVHRKIGLRSRLLALANFVGLGLLTLAYFGSRIVSELIL